MIAFAWQVWLPIGLGVVACFYGLHRVALWLEARGHLYYWHKKPSGGRNVLLPFQEIIEPNVKHIHQIRDERKLEQHEPGAGGDEPPLE